MSFFKLFMMMKRIVLLIRKVIKIEGLVILIVLLFFLKRFVLIVFFKVNIVIWCEFNCFFKVVCCVLFIGFFFN